MTPVPASRTRICRTSSTPTGRRSAPRVSVPAAGYRSRKASSRRTADGSGRRASPAAERRSTSRFRWRARRLSRRNLQRIRHAELREEADQAAPFFVRRGVDVAEALHLLAVFAARHGEARRRLLRQKDAAAMPGALLEAVAEEGGVAAAHGLVAVDGVRRMDAAVVVPLIELAHDELGEHVAQAIAGVADRGEKAHSRLQPAVRIAAGEGAYDAALHGDLVLVPGEAQIGMLVVERRAVQKARAEDADFHDRHRHRAERRRERRIEEEALELAPFFGVRQHGPPILLDCRADPCRRAEAAPDLLPVLLGVPRHALHVVARLVERRDAAEALDVPLAGIVRGDGHALVAETVEELAEVLGARGDVRGRVERILAAEQAARLRDDLHQPLRRFARDQARAEVRFRLHHRGDELRREMVAPRLAVDDRSVRHLAVEELLLHRLDRHRRDGALREKGVGDWRGREEEARLVFHDGAVHRLDRKSEGEAGDRKSHGDGDAAAAEMPAGGLRCAHGTPPQRALANGVALTVANDPEWFRPMHNGIARSQDADQSAQVLWLVTLHCCVAYGVNSGCVGADSSTHSVYTPSAVPNGKLKRCRQPRMIARIRAHGWKRNRPQAAMRFGTEKRKRRQTMKLATPPVASIAVRSPEIMPPPKMKKPATTPTSSSSPP